MKKLLMIMTVLAVSQVFAQGEKGKPCMEVKKACEAAGFQGDPAGLNSAAFIQVSAYFKLKGLGLTRQQFIYVWHAVKYSWCADLHSAFQYRETSGAGIYRSVRAAIG